MTEPVPTPAPESEIAKLKARIAELEAQVERIPSEIRHHITHGFAEIGLAYGEAFTRAENILKKL